MQPSLLVFHRGILTRQNSFLFRDGTRWVHFNTKKDRMAKE